MRKQLLPALLLLGQLGCGDDGGPGPTTGGDDPAPDDIWLVADQGFQRPTSAAVSRDGAMIYFAASTLESPPRQALFAVSAARGAPRAPTQLHAGAPLEYATGMAIGCDSDALYIADKAWNDGDDDRGALFRVSTAGGAPTRIAADGIYAPSGIAMGPDCEQLYVTGYDEQGQGALFRVSTAGGPVTVIKAGAPLQSPTGLDVDVHGVSWVNDHVAGTGGAGVLFAIDGEGGTTVAADRLHLGTPGEVKRTSGDTKAIIPVVNRMTGAGELLAVEFATGDVTVIPAGDIAEPAGVGSARGAQQFAFTDPEGDKVFAAAPKPAPAN